MRKKKEVSLSGRRHKNFSPHNHPIWHPCSQMKDYESFPPLQISNAEGSYLYTQTGKPLIDAISSWWCKPLGHRHPRLHAALLSQSSRFEHVILANTTYDIIEKLSHALLTLNPPMYKVFYSGDGSSAIEIALKMSLQYHAQTTAPHRRTQFAYLKHAYHGENLLSLSISDLNLYKNPFKKLCLENVCLPAHSLLTGRRDPQWNKPLTKDDTTWHAIYETLEQHKETLAGIIIEPIVQGAGGMKIHAPALIDNLRTWSRQYNIHIIADEIMTGLGRTGAPLAMHHSQSTSDITVLMKGLSAGYLPFSAILTTKEIYDAFYDDFETHKAFIHSNTYSGNALGAAVALEALSIYKEQDWFNQVAANEMTLTSILSRVAKKTGVLKEVRGIGWIAAAELRFTPHPTQKSSLPRPALAVFKECAKLGLFIRPLGNTLYLLPPFNISSKTLQTLEAILTQALLNLKNDYPLE
ncbi:adenosylmethionine-8-amino-7-oxononanoate aminotransferase [Spirochaetota bacterium]|nr:adenosylmethionine-8-amino-7-oxononanoate aminotransferase [Spirochaetota bacterium]